MCITLVSLFFLLLHEHMLSTTTTTTISPILNGNPHDKDAFICIPCQDSAKVTDRKQSSRNASCENDGDTKIHNVVKVDTLAGWKQTASMTVSINVKEHPAQVFKSRLPPLILVSCLKRRGATSVSTHGRRVRGLWNPSCCCLFSHLHNGTIVNVLSFLNMKDLVTCFRVCRRWNHVAASPALWQRVDATEFVQATFQQHCKNKSTDARVATSQTLLSYLQHYATNIKSLTICSIQTFLDANSFLPTITSSLQELTLTGYANLTDTHVKVMFLSTKHNNIHTLVLKDCPLLTNATIESISRHAKHVQTLSLQKCRNITSIHALQDVWDVATLTDSTNTTAMTSLQSLFAPMHASDTSPCGGGPPPRFRGGKLSRLDICGTSVTGPALIESLNAVKGKVRLQELCISDDLSNDLDLWKLASAVVDKESWNHVKICHANGMMTTMGKILNSKENDVTKHEWEECMSYKNATDTQREHGQAKHVNDNTVKCNRTGKD